MAKVRGKSEVRAYMDALPRQITRMLRGAGKAGGQVIADEAKDRAASDEVAGDIIVKTKRDANRIVVTVTVRPGYNWFRALWLEYGTDPHFISVSESERKGRSIGRVNQQLREAGGNASLVIGGKFVGETVFHPGARPYPFLRPALDVKEADAVRAAQAYINASVSRRGITVSDEGNET
jgi:Bacteriophage protein of unknown function (DUF646).